MIDKTHFIHYGTIAAATAINAIGVGIGQGLTSRAAIAAINQQPSAKNEITRTAILGMALIETAAVMGTFLSFLLLLQARQNAHSYYSHLSEIGIALAICCSGFVLGLVSALPARAACLSIARQPFFAAQITRYMMISLSLLQTPIIFGLIIGLIIQSQAASVTTLRDSLRLISAGLCIGLGSIGPAIGLAAFAEKACEGLGKNRHSYGRIFSFTLVSQAIIETPIIFSLIIAISLLLLIPSSPDENIIDGISFIAAALCTGLGTLGPGIGSGRTARIACDQIVAKPEMYSVLSRLSMFAQGLIETCVIYSVLISFMLLFYR